MNDLGRMHYYCVWCGHQTPVPDGWKSEDGPPKCETPGCDERQERHRKNRKVARAQARKALMERAKVTDEDREKRDGPFLKTHYYIPEYGRQGWMVTCSECGEYFRLFEWSYAGKGKKCPGCGFHFSRWLHGPFD